MTIVVIVLVGDIVFIGIKGLLVLSLMVFCCSFYTVAIEDLFVGTTMV